MADYTQAAIERRTRDIDELFARRAAKLKERHGVPSLLDIPRAERERLFTWRADHYRRAYGRDPKTGELLNARVREARAAAREDEREER